MSMTNFRAEDMMKVSRAKDSKKDADKSASESPQDQRRSDQTSGQQSVQESGEPTSQESEDEKDDEQTSEEDEGKSDDSEPVPHGTTAEILRWVGEDQSRAQRALDKEQAEDRPRAGLTGELNKILGKEQ